ncbi:hypothetical protein LBMAG49_25990 [Planctomycetota bacterium]|nr:hypothetical protein LBMAG49_25990 [Planctomycetota bacterium]
MSVWWRAVACFAASLLAGCVLLQREPYDAGMFAVASGELPLALQGFDAVPPSDVHFAEARMQAAAIDRRLREHAEQLLLGLHLRSIWRDDEALAAFEHARELWPENPDVAMLICATQARGRTQKALLIGFAAEAIGDNSMASVPGPVPGMELLVNSAPLAIDEQVPDASNQELSLQLANLEGRLVRGDVESVLGELLLLHRSHPSDVRVRVRYARLLQQRGLIRYGQGNVRGAIADWQRACAVDPEQHTARRLLDLAAPELSDLPR